MIDYVMLLNRSVGSLYVGERFGIVPFDAKHIEFAALRSLSAMVHAERQVWWVGYTASCEGIGAHITSTAAHS